MNLEEIQKQFAEMKTQIDEMRGAVTLLESEIETIADRVDSYDEAEQHEVKMVRKKYAELRDNDNAVIASKTEEKATLENSLTLVGGMFMITEALLASLGGMIEKDKVVNAVEEVLDDEESKSLVLGLLDIEQEPAEVEALQQEAIAQTG